MSGESTVKVINASFLEQNWLKEHKITDNNNKILKQAVERAIARSIYGVVPPIILLLTILRWEKKVGKVIIEMCGVDLFEVEKFVDKYLAGLANELSGGKFIDFRDVLEVVERACVEANALSHDYVASEHITLALWAYPDVIISEISDIFGITYDMLKTNLDNLLRQYD